MVIPRDSSDAWEAGHVVAQMLDSRGIPDVVLDSESPWHCHCPGGALPLRRGKHCDCIAKHSKRAPPGLQHDVVTDAESPAHCVCPATEVPVHYGDGHCACFKPRSKRQNDPVPKSSEGLSKAVVTAIKSVLTAPKLSVTIPSTFVTNAKSSATQQNSSESTAQVTAVTVKAVLPSAKVSTITSAIKAPQPTEQEGSEEEGSEQDEPEQNESDIIDVPLTLPILHPPILICLFGACFAPSELSSITSSLAKRADNRNFKDLVHLGGSCSKDGISICLQDHRKCFCQISKRQVAAAGIAPSSLVEACSNKELFVCGTEPGSCNCVEIPTGSLSPIPESCDTGGLICFQGLCYCPLETGRKAREANARKIGAIEAGTGPTI